MDSEKRRVQAHDHIGTLRKACFAAFVIACSSGGGLQAATLYRPIDASYKLTFDEEFNGSTLDASKWFNGWYTNSAGLGQPVNASELEAYDVNRVSVSGGYLNLSAIASSATVNGKTYQYRSGLISTFGKFSQAYGYFESRVCLPGSSGVIANWPAWWAVGPNWPTGGELDIMEGLSGRAAYHFHSPAGGPGASVVGDYTGCHVYAALWVPGSVQYFYDGTSVGTITDGITSGPQSLILNLAVGSYGGPILIPSTMTVDYVRVWSNSSSAAAVTPQPGYDGPGAVANTPAPTATPPVTPVSQAVNLVPNPGFEQGASGWQRIGNARVVTTGARTGAEAAILSGTAGFQRTVVGLKRNSAYLLTGYVKSLDGKSCPAIGVKGMGSAQVANCSVATTYTSIQIPFRTGASNTSAIVFYYQGSGSSQGDDISLIAR